MGCDIHLWTEIKTDGKWQPRTTPTVAFDGDDEYLDWPSEFDDRNYALFATLADVRNSGPRESMLRLFDTGWHEVFNDKIDPIEAPRGIPEGASDAFERMASEWGVDGHSHSWFTLQELLVFDWDEVSGTRRAYVRPRQPGDIGRFATVDDWARGVERLFERYGDDAWKFGAGWRWEMFMGSSRVADAREIEWTPTYAQNASSFLLYLFELCRYAATKGIPATDVRLVFFFDN